MATLNHADRPICGPYATAQAVAFKLANNQATGTDVEMIIDDFRRVFKKGPRWKGKSSISEIQRILRLYDIPSKMKEVSGYTLRRWVEMETAKGRSYIVRTGNHFQFVKDGIVTDQMESNHADGFHWSGKRVTHVIEIKGE